MTWIMAVLAGLAALLLSVPALVVGSLGYAAIALVAIGGGYAAGRLLSVERSANALLILNIGVAVAGLQRVGVPVAFAAAAVVLCLFAWNAAHRFAPTESAPTSREDSHRFAAQYLLRAIPASLGLGGLLALLPLVRLRLTFGIALSLSIGLLLLAATFIRILHTRSREAT